MSRNIQRYTETDLRRALNCAGAAGLEVQRFEIDRSGKIVVITAGKSSATTERTEAA